MRLSSPAMPSLRARAALLVAVLAVAACSAASPTTTVTTTPSETTVPATTTTPTTLPPRVPGPIGDPYFPELGDSGIDVREYRLDLLVDPDLGEIVTATAEILAHALRDLPAVHLDLIGLAVRAVRVDGVEVPARRDGPKLIVQPPQPLRGGTDFVVAVDYGGRPEPFRIPGFDTPAGWVVTAEGVHVVAQPDGARTWFPSNDHPSDKATFTIAVTVPAPFVAVANGSLVERVSVADGARFVWRMDEPMATYLATVVVGELVEVEQRVAGRVRIRDYLPADLADPPPAPLRRAPDMLEFLETWFGPYPFSTYGHVVVPDFAIALETQTMAVLGRLAIDDRTVVHELAHQWFGNSVSVATWQDVWLSEGFASFAELLWIEHDAGSDAMLAEVRRRHAVLSARPHRPIIDPGLDELFGIAVYWRGSLTLHALRLAIGDETLREVLTIYAARFEHGNASTADFVAVAEEVSGVDLVPLFEAWLRDVDLPPLPD
jgi:aminopeptidase N